MMQFASQNTDQKERFYIFLKIKYILQVANEAGRNIWENFRILAFSFRRFDFLEKHISQIFLWKTFK